MKIHRRFLNRKNLKLLSAIALFSTLVYLGFTFGIPAYIRSELPRGFTAGEIRFRAAEGQVQFTGLSYHSMKCPDNLLSIEQVNLNFSYISSAVHEVQIFNLKANLPSDNKTVESCLAELKKTAELTGRAGQKTSTGDITLIIRDSAVSIENTRYGLASIQGRMVYLTGDRTFSLTLAFNDTVRGECSLASEGRFAGRFKTEIECLWPDIRYFLNKLNLRKLNIRRAGAMIHADLRVAEKKIRGDIKWAFLGVITGARNITTGSFKPGAETGVELLKDNENRISISHSFTGPLTDPPALLQAFRNSFTSELRRRINYELEQIKKNYFFWRRD